MKHVNWKVMMGIILILLSFLIYALHFYMFKDLHHILIYFIGDIAFLPIEVLLVTLILHQLLAEREKQQKLNKMNMVIGSFFNEVGFDLLKQLNGFEPELSVIRERLLINTDWKVADYKGVKQFLEQNPFHLKSKSRRLADLKSFIRDKRTFLLQLVQNPNLLEHESFTNLLWAVFHLADELCHRDDLSHLPDKDHEHLNGDMNRAYHFLISEWIDYMRHLQKVYPYLFSLAVRLNPFARNSSVIIRQV